MIGDLPASAPELVLAEKLSAYRDLRACRLADESRPRRAAAELVWSGLQQRLLSSIEAFARTLAVHEHTLARLLEQDAPPLARLSNATNRLITGIGSDDDEADLGGSELAAEEDAAVEAATTAGMLGAGPEWPRAIERELQAVREMRELATPIGPPRMPRCANCWPG